MQSCLNRAGLGAILLKIVCALLTLHPSGASAQTAVDGALNGIVIEPAGTPISGATLQAKDLATSLTIQTTSGPDGQFLFPRLPPANTNSRPQPDGSNLSL